jgi:uncharacterized protein YbaP (TraB family)
MATDDIGNEMRRHQLKESQIIIVMLLALTGLVALAGEENDRSFLWRVRSNNTTVYLLGSVHLMKEDAYPLADSIEEAFERSQVMMFEVDLDQLTTAALKLLSEGSLPEGETLQDVISEETLKLVTARIRDLGYEPARFERMRPWLLAITLTSHELARAGYGQTSGIDVHFFERAKAANKERLALETVDFQIQLFAGLSEEENEAFLRHTLDDLDAVIPFVDDLMQHWCRGHVPEVEKLLTEAYQEFPELFRRLVSERNRSWLPRVEELLAGDTGAMVVVGALHLVGKEGLIELLKRKGYSVEQL